MSAKAIYQQVAAKCAYTGEHIWQALGLGRAPFRSVEMIQTGQPGPCPLGECFVCGTKLLNNFVIADAEDKVFVVGCECVKALDNDEALIASVLKLKAEHDANEKAKKAAETLEQWKFDNHELYERMIEIETHPKIGPLIERLHTKGALTELQYKSVIEKISLYEQEDNFHRMNLEHGHAIRVGTRLQFSGYMNSSRYCSGGSVLTLVNTSDGYQLKTFELPMMLVGSLVTLTGTVRRHETYNGERQLMLTDVVLDARAEGVAAEEAAWGL